MQFVTLRSSITILPSHFFHKVYEEN